jgi:hypothetical protein
VIVKFNLLFVMNNLLLVANLIQLSHFGLTGSGFPSVAQKELKQLPDNPIMVLFGPSHASVIRIREQPSQLETVLDILTPPAHGQSLPFFKT